MWTCAICKRNFRNANQWHSCKIVEPVDHFKNKPPIIKTTFNKLITRVNKITPVTVHVLKSAIYLKTSSTFVEIKPKREYLLIAFYLNKEVKDLPISKVIRLSKNRFVHEIHLQDPSDINKQVIDFLKESYKLLSKQ